MLHRRAAILNTGSIQECMLYKLGINYPSAGNMESILLREGRHRLLVSLPRTINIWLHRESVGNTIDAEIKLYIVELLSFAMFYIVPYKIFAVP